MEDLQEQLFEAIRNGDIELVKRLVFSLAGTGIFCQRLGLLEMKASDGYRAEDLAKACSGYSKKHEEIYEFLKSERIRMEFFE